MYVLYINIIIYIYISKTNTNFAVDSCVFLLHEILIENINVKIELYWDETELIIF